jgi:long-chain fatty acid transport protein
LGQQHNTVTIITPNGAMPFQQDWKDQLVIALGLSYKFTDAFTGRLGYNMARTRSRMSS